MDKDEMKRTMKELTANICAREIADFDFEGKMNLVIDGMLESRSMDINNPTARAMILILREALMKIGPITFESGFYSGCLAMIDIFDDIQRQVKP